MQLKSLLMVALLALLGVSCAQRPVLSSSQLSSDGVLAYQVDDQVLVVLATDRLFKLDKPNQINPAMYDHITRLAESIKYDHPSKVEIHAYANQNSLKDESLRLTQQQARTLAAYLWSQGIDSKVMIYNGFGQDHPVASDNSFSADYTNNRIEVRWLNGSTAKA